MNVVKEFFGSRSLLKELNATFLVLIPKKPRATELETFKPISLCNYFYKIISKVLTSRILLILPSLISPHQNGFVPRRKIFNSIVTIHENIQSLVESKTEGFLLKLDISKAYDLMDWKFLFKIMRKFGFYNRVLQMVEQCVSTISISIMVNGSPSCFF